MFGQRKDRTVVYTYEKRRGVMKSNREQKTGQGDADAWK